MVIPHSYFSLLEGLLEGLPHYHTLSIGFFRGFYPIKRWWVYPWVAIKSVGFIVGIREVTFRKSSLALVAGPVSVKAMGRRFYVVSMICYIMYALYINILYIL